MDLIALQTDIDNNIPTFVKQHLCDRTPFDNALQALKKVCTGHEQAFQILGNAFRTEWVTQIVNFCLSEDMTEAEARESFCIICGEDCQYLTNLLTLFTQKWKELSTPQSPVETDSVIGQCPQFTEPCLSIEPPEPASAASVSIALIALCNKVPIKIPILLSPDQVIPHVSSVLTTAKLDSSHLPHLLDLSASLNKLISNFYTPSIVSSLLPQTPCPKTPM